MREKSTGYVVLGILAIGGDLSGYEVRQWIAQAIGFFWSESFGQIYPELKRLAQAKLIRPLDAGDAARGTKRYRITPAGREELRRWLSRPPRAEHIRNELLLKLFFGAVTGGKTAREFLNEAVSAYEARVRALAAAEALVIREDRTSGNLVYALMTVLSGQLVYAARLEWARTAITLIDAQEAGGNEAVLRAFAKTARSRSKGG